LLAAKQLIWILDIVEEHRSLSNAEILLRRDVKHRFLAMTAVEKLRAKQQSRISFLRAGEANSKLFFMAINGRKRKNFIQSLETSHGMVHLHKDREQEIYNHFNGLLGNQQNRSSTLDWGRLGLHRHDLQFLEEDFTVDEVKEVIFGLKSDKAPGPDGFIGSFFK